MNFRICPKCGHRPPQPIGATEACPACGVYMHKCLQMQQRAAHPPIDATPDATSFDWRARLTTLPSANDEVELAVRALVLIALALWGWHLASRDLASGEVMQSFMHAILLPIHEAGHIFTIPLGEFMTILGGSLFQLALPLGIGVAFLLKNRDPFGAALCLWWCGASLIDLAPYIYDALAPQLMLLGGHTGEDGPHDWIYLLERLGGLRRAHGWGRFTQRLGIAISSLAVVWAAWVLYRAYRRREHSIISDE